MSALLLLLAAAAGVSNGPSAPDRRPSIGTRAEATVAVRIVRGARIAMSESQDSGLPPLQHSSIRAESGELRPARLVEFN